MQALDVILDIDVKLLKREDGGLRAYSDQLPELTLSSKDCAALLRDIPKAIEVILSEKYKSSVEIKEFSQNIAADPAPPTKLRSIEDHDVRRYTAHTFAA